MDEARKAALEATRKDRLAWIELGAAQEREDLLEVLRAGHLDGSVAQVIEFLQKRQREAGVQVHRCGVADMDPAARP